MQTFELIYCLLAYVTQGALVHSLYYLYFQEYVMIEGKPILAIVIVILFWPIFFVRLFYFVGNDVVRYLWKIVSRF